MRLTLLSRASDLARIQTAIVADVLTRTLGAEIVSTVRAAAGDRDQQTPLAAMPDKGAFTADLSDALADGAADLVVHSWKDLPLEPRPDTVIAATLERADPRDLLLIRRDVIADRPPLIRILTSSPRRAWLLERAVSSFLPWPIESLQAVPVRGNVPTRLRKLLDGPAHGLLVAKAAIDRLLDPTHPFDEPRRAVREAIDRCAWMVLPISACPTAPAQGALAIEVARRRADLVDALAAVSHAPTWRAVVAERAVLAEYGGGCHLALGATCLTRDFGDVIAVRGRRPDGAEESRWALASARPSPPRIPARAVWPRPEERDRALRRPLDVHAPSRDRGLWVTRADALPSAWPVSEDQPVWAAGVRTWAKLAARGVWVHGCADGLGDREAPAVDRVAGRPVAW
ncbi:MAG TPA: hydroxymethylbilane synthase, partial [Vicinamibacterales bacterium]|nr:hydroxymethylbilane synthase [Vicinamibacterales bacterium]